ncbi:MAG: hypothetical protein RIS70_2728 [Planctomycetota bacterium]|jgi:hypothetical protein
MTIGVNVIARMFRPVSNCRNATRDPVAGLPDTCGPTDADREDPIFGIAFTPGVE